eukprot:121609-Prymnesium_polylepis.1
MVARLVAAHVAAAAAAAACAGCVDASLGHVSVCVDASFGGAARVIASLDAIVGAAEALGSGG